jgi:hypothetical protein
MEVPTSQSQEKIDHASGDYFDWTPEGTSISIRLHHDAIDYIAHAIAPDGDVECGGLLLGHVEFGDHVSIRIERCQLIPCGHRLGPKFTLDSEDQAALVGAAERILKNGDLSVVGLYRSHKREGLQLEMADFELISRYFSDPSDVMLLVKPEGRTALAGRFFRREADNGVQPLGQVFPFGEGTRRLAPDSGERDKKEIAPPTADAEPTDPEPPASMRRLVPDFVPAAVEPSRAPRPEPVLVPPSASTTARRSRNWLPLLAAICLVGGGAWFLLAPKLHLPGNTPIVAEPSAADRPLGLYVDPALETWRVSWNPNATALHDARNVQLFVREGDDQKRFDLSPGDLSSGMYQYKPAGNDVTFRLEIIENSGRVSAESFRVMRAGAPVPAPAPVLTSPPATAPTVNAHITEPRAIHKVPPVVPMSIKPRIKDAIPIDVRVHIDAEGRVTSATPVVKQPAGLHAFLAGRAVEAAKLWRFEPARQNGRSVPGRETIHFVFEN